MAFKQVFCALREVFPQVDLRILKAVASQYSCDVDAAVEFVLSDVLPVVSEPIEAHYTLQHIDYAKDGHSSSSSSDFSGEGSLSSGYGGPLCTTSKLENMEDKLVINETKITPTEDYAQTGASLTSASISPVAEYRGSTLTAVFDHCAIGEGKVSPDAGKLANQKHFDGSYNLAGVLLPSNGLPSVIVHQSLSESEDSFDQHLLFGKGVSLKHSSDISKPQDSYDLQVMFGNTDNGGKESDILHAAESNPEKYKSEDDLNKKTYTSDSSIRVSRFPMDENQQICAERDYLYTVNGEEESSMEFMNPTFTNTRNLNDDFNLSKLLSSTPNISVSDLDSKCEVREEAERKIMCSNSVDKHSFVPVIVHDTSSQNGMTQMPGSEKYDEFVNTTGGSYQVAGINNLVSDISNAKEVLSSLYELTNVKMMEVELQEETSRKAKQDAFAAHQAFVTMVENFNQLLENSRESNDKQAEMVHGEKSMLAAQSQDLQSRLTKLSALKDDVLTIVEEIKLELDARLATSVEEEAEAREWASQNEKLALLVQKEKDAEMANIMEESRKLQKELQENKLLRDYLSNQGRIIDMLQGEISSIHGTVVALKESCARSKLQTALVTSATSSPEADSKAASPDTHKPLKSQNSSILLPQEKMARSHSKDRVEFPDDEWEMLEITQE